MLPFLLNSKLFGGFANAGISTKYLQIASLLTLVINPYYPVILSK